MQIWHLNLIRPLACSYLSYWTFWRNDDDVTLWGTWPWGIAVCCSSHIIKTGGIITMKNSLHIYLTCVLDLSCVCIINYHCDSSLPLHVLTSDLKTEGPEIIKWDMNLFTSQFLVGILQFKILFSLTCIPASLAELFLDSVVTDCREEVSSEDL